MTMWLSLLAIAGMLSSCLFAAAVTMGAEG